MDVAPRDRLSRVYHVCEECEMQNIQLIWCVGKLKEKFYLDAAAEYVKRLSGYCK